MHANVRIVYYYNYTWWRTYYSKNVIFISFEEKTIPVLSVHSNMLYQVIFFMYFSIKIRDLSPEKMRFRICSVFKYHYNILLCLSLESAHMRFTPGRKKSYNMCPQVISLLDFPFILIEKKRSGYRLTSQQPIWPCVFRSFIRYIIFIVFSTILFNISMNKNVLQRIHFFLPTQVVFYLLFFLRLSILFYFLLYNV